MGVVKFDNYAMSQFQTCERKYQYRIVNGLVPQEKGPALAFGIAFHAAYATFITQIQSGTDYPIAAFEGAKQFRDIWDKEMPPEQKAILMSTDKRSVMNGIILFNGYLDKFYNPSTRGPVDYKTKYVEIPFAISIGRTPAYDDELIWTGIMDELGYQDGSLRVVERKTSAIHPGANWAQQFELQQAISGYVLAAMETSGEPVHGALMHGVWVHTEPARKTAKSKSFEEYFTAIPVGRTPEQIEEFKTNALHTADAVRRADEIGFYKMNLGTACGYYGGCPYAKLCKAPPSLRDTIINMEYVKESWDPLDTIRAKPEGGGGD